MRQGAAHRTGALPATVLALCLFGAPALAAPPSASWPAAWGDEFNGTSLDSTRWKWGSLPWGGQHHTDDYASWITSQDSYVQNGSLWLRCREASGSEFGGYPYSEGFVHTDGRKNYTYGYVEIRARFPAGKGVWPAFWMLSWGWPPEFDVAELFGSDDRMHMGLAYGSSSSDVTWSSSNFYGEGWSSWHTYGLEWGPGYAIWYKDGAAKKSIYADHVPDQAMYIILNSGMRWDADGSTPLPSTFEIDYCRIFSPPSAAINDNTTGSGLNQFRYTGTWSYASRSGAYFGDNHWSGVTGNTYEVAFTGVRADLYAAKAPNHGIAAVSIDGGTEQLVDFYASARSDKILVWSSPSLAAGAHTLRVRVTGNKNTASTGYTIPADRVDIWQVGSRLNGTTIGTAGSWNDSGNTRAMAFDGNLDTFFDAPSADGAWAGLDLGANAHTRITKVRYCPRGSYAARMVGGRFQGANQASFADAVDLFAVAAAPPVEAFSEQAIANPGGFRYVRYLSPSGGYCNAAEIEFEGYAMAPAPANLTATPAHSQITLTWSASAGATGYSVKRSSVSGGPYEVLVAKTAQTSFTDSGLTTAALYHYVVSALNSGGEGPDSSEVSARSLGPHFDFDGDADVDAIDVSRFRGCLTGSGLLARPADCSELQFAGADSDADGDVDQSDFGFLQRCLCIPATAADPVCR